LGGFGRGSGAGAGAIGPYQPAETALVADEVPADRRADAFGWLSFASGVGALAGGLLAGLAQPPPGAVGAAANLAYRPAFVAMGVLALASGLLALALRESRPTPARPAGPKVARTWPRRSWDALWRFWLTNAANGAAMGLFGPFVSYWLYRRYGASPQAIGLLFAVVNLTSLGSVLSAAPLARRWGTVRTIVWARLVSGVLLVPMVQAPSFTLAGAVYVVRMLAQRVGLPLRQSYVQAWTHPQERASMAALTNLPAQVTQGLGQVAAGYLMDEVGLSVPFELAAGFQCLNAFLYALLFRGREEGRAGASSG
jgi:MFS family permease